MHRNDPVTGPLYLQDAEPEDTLKIDVLQGDGEMAICGMEVSGAVRLRVTVLAMLLSLCGNLRITQVVNPLKGCIAELPRYVLAHLENTNARSQEK